MKRRVPVVSSLSTRRKGLSMWYSMGKVRRAAVAPGFGVDLSPSSLSSSIALCCTWDNLKGLAEILEKSGDVKSDWSPGERRESSISWGHGLQKGEQHC